MDNVEYEYIIQIHRDDSYWYARPCKDWEEVKKSMEVAKEWAEEPARIWFRIFKHHQDIR